MALPAGIHRSQVGRRYVESRFLGGSAVEQSQVIAERPPVAIFGKQQPVERSKVVMPVLPGQLIDRGVGNAVGHEDFGGETLAGLGPEVFFLEEPAVAVVMNVYEAGGNDLATGVCGLFCGSAAEIADGFDPVASNPNVARKASLASAVDNRAAGDEEVEHQVSEVESRVWRWVVAL